MGQANVVVFFPLQSENRPTSFVAQGKNGAGQLDKKVTFKNSKFLETKTKENQIFQFSRAACNNRKQ